MVDRHEFRFGDDIVGAVEDWGEKTLVPVSIIGGRHMASCLSNRETFKKNDINLTQAHASACSALMNLASRSARRNIGEVAGAHAQQLDLIAHFIQGIHLCEAAVVEGLYVQAATLLRQEHELVSAVQELGIDKRADGKTPHATVGVLKNMGRVYGELSGAAHVSQSHLLHEIIKMESGDLKAPSILPVYHRDLARNLYSLHVCYIVLMARIAGEIHEGIALGGPSQDELKLLSVAIGILSDEGLIRIEEVPLDEPIAEPSRPLEK